MLYITALKNKLLIFLLLALIVIGETRIAAAETCQIAITAWNSSDVDFEKPVTFHMKVATMWESSEKLKRNETWTRVLSFDCLPTGSFLNASGTATSVYTPEPLGCRSVQFTATPGKPVAIEYEATIFKPSSTGNAHWFENSCTITVKGRGE